MKTIGAFEAKTRLSELLDLVDRGERVTITRRGKRVTITRRGTPVAMLVPVSGKPTLTPTEAADALRRLRTGVALDGVPLRELIEEGRR